MADMIDIRAFGAVGDGATLNTQAVQAAIDECSRTSAPGVLVAGGRFVIGTIFLKDDVTLHIAGGAVLAGSTDIADYAPDVHKNMYRDEPHMDRCLIFARGARRIAIEGKGTIDGRGGHETFRHSGQTPFHRPMMIRFLECSCIRMHDITLRDPAAWTSAWLYCDDIAVDGVTISSRANGNGDGLDFDGCTGVRVSNCSFDTSDDSICLQASRPDRPCRDVTVSNCVFCSHWAGMRIGLLSRGDIRNVAVTNCVFRDINDSGLKIQLCEGGVMENMAFSNLVMENVPRPIFMTFGQQRACVDAPPGVAPMQRMGNMTFSNIVADSSMCGKDSAIILVGLPGHCIENIALSDISLTTAGGAAAGEIDPAPLPDLTLEQIGRWWPEYFCFKRTVPACGLYAAHLRGLTLRNVQLRTAAPDARPTVFCHDVPQADLGELKQ
ncbi:MAG: hypothetical protein LLG01_15405 [Planctomycetaceae bacterium]|nr:hypothetical protein [Planctomycetaceae bacterium]